jgi:hypothetical protein
MTATASTNPTGGPPPQPALSTATTAPAPGVPGPDPRVAAAFALGWQMAELYRPEHRRHRLPASPDDLPSLGRLEPGEILRLGIDQVKAGVAMLADTIARAGLAAPGITAVERTLMSEDVEVRRPAVKRLHVDLLIVLTAANFRLGKAYGLGRALGDTCRNPADIESMRTELARYRVATLQKWLDDLGSALPPHAGHSVSSSLSLWTEWIHNGAVNESPAHALSAFRRQGELWRALLSGEKHGTDMLEIQNYLDAAGGFLRRLRLLVLRALVRFPLLTALVVVLFGGGIALILAKHTSASIAAGLAGIVASLGISWKSLAGSIGKLATRLEQPLWGAELDAAIVDAITLLPKNKRDHKDRRQLAIRADAGPKQKGDRDADRAQSN